jgi:hypothetical protein
MSRAGAKIVALLLGIGVILGAMSSRAHHDTAPSFPVLPDPALCEQEPLALERVEAVWAMPAATPVGEVDLSGEPVDEATRAAVSAAIVELFACLNGGDRLRAYALYTESYLARILATETDESLAMLATPIALDEDEWTVVVDIRDMRRLPDGRVYATVVLDPALIPVQKLFGVFLVERESRWLIDDILDELRFSLP